MMNRRKFLTACTLGSAMPLLGLNQQAFASTTPIASRRLILVELAGANDGLNTLVPYSNDHYHKLRPTIGLQHGEIIALSDELGIHAALKPLMPLWERGELAWVQGLGYPKPNRSHFKSIALWETAGDGHRSRGSDGWMTHAIEHQLGRQVIDPHGISLAGDLGLFASSSGRWLSTGSVKELLQQTLPDSKKTDMTHSALEIVQRRIQTLDTTLSGLRQKLQSIPAREQLPRFAGGGFGEQLRQVSLMIAAGLDTPVFRVQLRGFDTHDNQPARHQKLMTTLAQALASFSSTMRELGEWDNTLLMSYSEFGRRAAENRSRGTDHGTAAPHLLMGGSIAGGLYGDAPDLANLPDGDPVHTLDYRALYQAMLADGLRVKQQAGALAQYADDRLSGLVRNG